MKKAFNFIFGAALGGVIGAATALLLAPSSGQEIRQDLENRLRNIQSEIKEAASERRIELERQLEELKTPSSKKPKVEG